MNKWNGNIFTVENNSLSMLEIVEEHGEQLNNKTDLYGDHKGSWQGLNRPTLSEEGIRATVEDIIDNKIPSIQSSLDTIANDTIPSIDKKRYKITRPTKKIFDDATVININNTGNKFY